MTTPAMYDPNQSWTRNDAWFHDRERKEKLCYWRGNNLPRGPECSGSCRDGADMASALVNSGYSLRFGMGESVSHGGQRVVGFGQADVPKISVGGDPMTWGPNGVNMFLASRGLPTIGGTATAGGYSVTIGQDGSVVFTWPTGTTTFAPVSGASPLADFSGNLLAGTLSIQNNSMGSDVLAAFNKAFSAQYAAASTVPSPLPAPVPDNTGPKFVPSLPADSTPVPAKHGLSTGAMVGIGVGVVAVGGIVVYAATGKRGRRARRRR